MVDSKIDIGTNVHYIPFKGCDKSQYENGKVKSHSDDKYVFVVYHCADEWDTGWKNYTAARTSIQDLNLGWVEVPIKNEEEK